MGFIIRCGQDCSLRVQSQACLLRINSSQWGYQVSGLSSIVVNGINTQVSVQPQSPILGMPIRIPMIVSGVILRYVWRGL